MRIEAIKAHTVDEAVNRFQSLASHLQRSSLKNDQALRMFVYRPAVRQDSKTHHGI